MYCLHKIENHKSLIRKCKKSHLIQMCLGYFLTNEHNLIWFAVCILQVKINQTKLYYVTMQTLLISHSIQNSNILCLNLTNILLLILRVCLDELIENF